MNSHHQNESKTDAVARVERSLLASELRYRRLFETAKDGILILDADTGRIDDVNPFLMDLLGFSRSEIVGKTVGELSPFKDIESNQAMLERLQQNGYVRYEDLPLETRNGRNIAVEFVSNVYQAGDRKVIQCNIRDITERKWSSEALRKSEQNFRSIFTNAPVGIFQSTVNCLLSVNPALAKMFGYESPGEMFARSVDPEAHFVQHDQRCRIIREAMELETYAVHEVEYRRKDGSTFTANLQMRAVRDKAGEVEFLRGFVEDCTERKRAEEALRASETQYRLLADNLADVIWTFDLQTMRFTYTSPSVQFLRGYTAEEAIAQSLEQILTPESMALVKSWLGGRITAFLAGDPAATTQVYELDLMCKGGATVSTETVTTFLRNNDGGLSVVGVSRDITNRREMEERITRLLKQQQVILDASPVGIALTKERTVQWSNPAHCAMFGRTHEEMQGLESSSAYAEKEDYDRVGLEGYTQIAQGLTFTAEVKLKRKDGERFWCLIKGRALDPADISGGVIWLLLDVNEQKKAEQALTRSQAELAAIYDSSPIMMCLVNSQHQVERMNRAMNEFAAAAGMSDFGQRPGDVLGCVDALDNPQGCGGGKGCANCPLRLAILQSFESGQPCRQVESKLLLARGSVRQEFYVLASTSMVRLGTKPRVLLCLEDISRRKRLEAQFLQAQKMEAIGQLAGGVAHDFNNVLAAILMQIGLLRQNAQLSGETRESLKEVERESMLAASMTRQLLLFSRRHAAQIERLDMDALIKDLMTMLRRLLGENIAVSFQGCPGGIWVHADAGMMEQVVMNLCINARDAMSKAGQLTLATTLEEIKSQTAKRNRDARPGRFACLTVTDTGCGMDETVLGKIFEPFFTTKEPGKGTGLGLATVYGIVQQHQGWIEVESKLGKGSAFRVYLPAVAPPAVSAVPGQSEEIKGGSETILVVEDEMSLRRLVALSLRKLGYGVLEAGNGTEALKAWEEHHQKIDMLFTDMIMPEGMTGLDLAERFKKEKSTLKVIISSGYGADLAGTHPTTGLEIAYLPKPYAPSALAKAVRRCFDKT